jgi:hypothetical protein
MAEIITLVRVKTHGPKGLVCIDKAHCPKKLPIPCISQDGERYCKGIRDGAKIKELGKGKYLLECMGREK